MSFFRDLFRDINRAGIVQRPAGRLTLTLSHNTVVKRIFTRLIDKLDQAE